jgi:hypothetical protein
MNYLWWKNKNVFNILRRLKMGRKFGFSFSGKRALGISGMKCSISKKIGIPLTRQGRQRKAGRAAGCFVATAAYGDIDCEQVRFLRRFRDEVLLKTYFGCFFVEFYYKVGPFFAWFVKKSFILQNCSKCLLDIIIKLLKKK